ncbi:MAG: hypothetical protein ACLFVJ_10345 [Persicimonas sp.]
MTTSTDTHPDGRQPRIDESDFAQRPEEESSQSKTLKLILILLLIASGVIAIPVLVVLYSAGVQEIAGDDVEPGEQIEQQRMEEQLPRD